MTILERENGALSRFNELEARFKDSARRDDLRYRAVSVALGSVAGLTILDLGCGKGRFGRLLREAGARVVGLDGSREMIAGARGLVRVLGSALRLPFADRTFDAVVAIEVFEHLPDVEAAIREIARALKPSGTAVIIDKNALSLSAQRPWLPSALVRAIDRLRGFEMHPFGSCASERWFVPGRLARQLQERFASVSIDRPLWPDEAGKWVFRAVPHARRMVVWRADGPRRPA